MNSTCKLFAYKNILIFYTGFVKMILEVFGASGAVWGFSEVLTYRNEDTIEFWRYVCVAVALIFFIRYVIVMYTFSKKTLFIKDEGLPS